VTIPITETYTALERGVVDGTVVPWEGVVVFKLDDLLKYSTPTNFYTMTMMVVMNKRKWDSLPADVKKVINENSGLSFSLACGETYDAVEQPLKKRCLSKGMKVVELPPADINKLKALADPLRKEWVKEITAKGLPGKDVLDAAIQLLK
jgi:TRAP-type C4-dicarboxylate transport system substrate-binding protein